MRWVAIFEDTPEMLEVRARNEPAHLEFLRQHEEEILIAGGLRDVPGGPFVGGLWVLEVSSQERARQLVELDPYFKLGARSYKIRAWGKALAGKEVVL